MEVPVRFKTGICNGSGDLHRLGRLNCSRDHLQPARLRAGAGKLIVDMGPEFLLQLLVILGGAIRGNLLLQSRNDGSWKRRTVGEENFFSFGLGACAGSAESKRSEERRVGKEVRYRWS